jgi:hypothetical protein
LKNTKKYSFTILTISILLSLSCENRPDTNDVSSGWHTDLHWIADSLPALHYNLFMYEPEESLTVRLERLEQSLNELTDMETVMQLTRILASMKCSHTGLAFWEFGDWTAYPMSVMWLEDGLYVTAMTSEHSELIGSKLLDYGSVPALEAASRMAEMFPATNEVVSRTRAESFMMLAHPMEALGVGDADSIVSFRFLKATGDTITLDMHAVDQCSGDMVDFHTLESTVLPIWLYSDDFYWFRFLPERGMLYCAYNSCSLMNGYSMEDYIEDLQDVIDSEVISDLVIDLRRNSGGNSLIAAPLITWLGELSGTGEIAVSLIIGRWTYSSGILNALDISEIPGVTVYGENTGGAPNHLGEVRSVQLPWSGLSVSYPTKYFQTVEGPGTTMRPDIEIPLDSEMLFHGVNRILDAITAE